jgi:hypothetical protein
MPQVLLWWLCMYSTPSPTQQLLAYLVWALLSNVLLLPLLPSLLPTACAACPNDWKPYCVATAAFGPRTFANCCYAKCNGIKILNNVLHAGGCKDSCKSCDSRVEKPLCCSGRTYKNGCLALCNGEDTGSCSPGRCSTGMNRVMWTMLLISIY